MGPNFCGGLSRDCRIGWESLQGNAVIFHFLGWKRHDGLSFHDGSAPCRTEEGSEPRRKHLSPLRSDSKPLPKTFDGRGIRSREFCQRNHLALPEMAFWKIYISTKSR